MGHNVIYDNISVYSLKFSYDPGEILGTKIGKWSTALDTNVRVNFKSLGEVWKSTTWWF